MTRRLVGLWGERSTLQRAGQRIVRSMVQWGVLRDTATRGKYDAALRLRRLGPAVSLLLIEALLLDAHETSLAIEQLAGHPAVFPFDLNVNASQLRAASQFRVHRQGLDSDFVELDCTKASSARKLTTPDPAHLGLPTAAEPRQGRSRGRAAVRR